MRNMNEEERIKAMQYMIETKIKEIKEKHQTFVIYLPYAEIIGDEYKFGEVFKDEMTIYRNGNCIAFVKIWGIVGIG